MASIHGAPQARRAFRDANRVARVFVDDVTLGLLPPVCIKSGAAADGILPVRVSMSRFNPLWLLLILLGPIGWIVLAFVALRGDSGNALDLRLPMSEATMERYVRSRRRLSIAWVTLFVALISVPVLLVATAGTAPAGQDSGAGLGTLLWPLVGVAALAGLFYMAHCGLEARRTNVDVELDASGRWVTLSGVSPEFADAMVARERHPATTHRM